jgi:hypothetical protein
VTICVNTCQSEIRNQCQRAPPITRFGIDIGRMRLSRLVHIKQPDHRRILRNSEKPHIWLVRIL